MYCVWVCVNYLGSILNADNKMNVEIAEKIAKGNKAYYANSKLIKSKLLKQNTKMKVYKTMIRPVVTYSLETWALTHCGRVTQICVFNTVKLGTSASSP